MVPAISSISTHVVSSRTHGLLAKHQLQDLWISSSITSSVPRCGNSVGSINAVLRPAGLWTTFGLIQGMRLCMSVYDMIYIIYVCKCIYTRRYWYAYENQYDNCSCLETCMYSTHPSRCMWGLGWLPPKSHMFLASIGTHGGRGMLWSARRLTWLHQAKGHRKFLADHAQSQAYEHHRPAWEAITEVVRIMLRGQHLYRIQRGVAWIFAVPGGKAVSWFFMDFMEKIAGIFHSRPRFLSVSGFPALVRIGRDFGLRGNSQLLVAPEMPSLRAIDGNVEVQPSSLDQGDHGRFHQENLPVDPRTKRSQWRSSRAYFLFSSYVNRFQSV